MILLAVVDTAMVLKMLGSTLGTPLSPAQGHLQSALRLVRKASGQPDLPRPRHEMRLELADDILRRRIGEIS